MLLKSWSLPRSLAVFTLLACEATFAANDPELAGLAVYRDTGRDIYVAGLHTKGAQIPPDAASVDAPASMEYRIATRRISSRGFSGTLLLQAELGSGQRAPEGVLNVLDELKQSLDGSFLSGDQFIVRKTSAGGTDFYLNGTELLSVEGASTFDFLVQGWIGEGSSALMRDSLMSGRLETEKMVRFEGLAPSDERIAAVAGWQQAEETKQVEEQVAAVAEPEAKVEEKPVEKALVAAAVAAPVVTAPSAPKAASKVETAPKAKPSAKAEVEVAALQSVKAEPASEPQTVAPEPRTPAPEPEKVEPPVQVAEVEPAAPQAVLEPVQVAVTPIDDREYQRQLGVYVTQVMNKVLREVVYPNRAVRRQNQGSVELLAQFDGKGKLLEVTLGTSSGYKLLDKAALRAVREAAPFPEVSPVAQEEFAAGDGRSYVMAIPVRFELL